ncbi:hypothetical protein [Melittangium boletus]|uniref:Uncharacterized protein n=1 Tax=Melittangium boletus DSM 14713 TaxID=1294270 RepID=A0A250IB44_9BACT|nr:hypothetical protein [Melittangium boletus]ATB28186.1 hypothetical protein MEBOL_001632 [Melittangium boletus DSM 14713]
MALLPLVLLLSLGAQSDQTIPAGCREDYGTCREDCTIDYGGGTTKYRQLGKCIDGCTKERDACTTRHYSLRDTSNDMPSYQEPKESLADWEREESSGGGQTTPASGTVTDTSRRGVYRASQEEPAPREEDASEETTPTASAEEEQPAPAPLAPRLHLPPPRPPGASPSPLRPSASPSTRNSGATRTRTRRRLHRPRW